MSVARTERLTLRRLASSDAAFMLELLNDAAFIENIGDRGVRTLDAAEAYIANGPVASYERHGYGLYLVERNSDGSAIGISGLLRRDALDHADIGFAFLPEFRGKGYAREAARATLAHARNDIALDRVVAIVSPGNADSLRLLGDLGFRVERKVRMAPEADEIELLGVDLSAAPESR